ncbi:TetR/AcrR family transcriptional regulator [Streptomyces sp. NPDC092903]|uniref:TetR/AcrR family transcriptional regulator n=1 Tax=Streptomyces sp. NPDC092903 TaxID=3366017 RepID=UPI003802C0D3
MDNVTTDGRSARSRLLDAADRLFYAHGINATGVDAVIEAANVARMTFYRHFGGKDALVAAYLQARDARWRATVEECVTAAGDDPGARLLAVFEALRTWHADPRFRGCSFANAAAELTAPDHPARAVVTAHKQALRARITELAGATGHPAPCRLTDQLLLLIEGATTTQALGTVSDAVDEARAMAGDLIDARTTTPRNAGPLR